VWLVGALCKVVSEVVSAVGVVAVCPCVPLKLLDVGEIGLSVLVGIVAYTGMVAAIAVMAMVLGFAL